MVTVTISVNDFNDAITMEEWDIININLDIFQKAIETGGEVVFELRYNGESKELLKISNMDELKDWKAKAEKVIEDLKQIKIQETKEEVVSE